MIRKLQLIILTGVVFAFIILACPIAYQLNGKLEREWNPKPENIQKLEDAAALTEKRLEITGNIRRAQAMQDAGVLLIYGFGIAGFAITMGAGIWVYRKAVAPRTYYPENGIFPVVEHDSLLQLPGAKSINLSNLNQLPSPSTGIRMSNGRTDVSMPTAQYRPEDMLDSLKGQQTVQQIAAGKKSKSNAPSKWEVLERNGLLPHKPPAPEPVTPEDVIDAEVKVLPPLTPMKALADGSYDKGLILGYNEANHPLRYVPAKAPHIALMGSTQMGKSTGTATTLVLGALANMMHVVILDPEEEGYWMDTFGAHTEVIHTPPEASANAIEMLYSEYLHRGDMMQAEGVKNIKRAQTVNPVLVVIEEFSDMLDNMQGDVERALRWLERIMRRGAKRGMNLCLIDQHNRMWPSAVKQNALFRLSHAQPVKDHSLVGFHDMDILTPGEFAHQGQVYRTFHWESELENLLRTVPKSRHERLSNKRRHPRIFEENIGEGESTVRGVQPVPTPEHRRYTPPFENVPEWHRTLSEQAATNTQDDEWDDAVREFFKNNPHGGQGDLARYLAAIDPLGRDWSKFKGSTSMDLWHCHSPKGDPSKIVTAKRRKIWLSRQEQ